MPMFLNVEAFLLVGGKSSRMGRDKALLELNGTSLIQRTAQLLAPLAAKTTLVTSATVAHFESTVSSEDPKTPLNATTRKAATLSATPENTNRYSNFGLPTLADRWPDAGPLSGIATALSATKTPWCLILACDMPFLSHEWLKFLLVQIAQSESKAGASQSNSGAPRQTDIIIPETERGLEPLCAVYRSTCAPTLAAALGREVRKVTDAIATLNLNRVTEEEWRRFSPGGNLFGNLNTWEDYLEAQKYLKS